MSACRALRALLCRSAAAAAAIASMPAAMQEEHACRSAQPRPDRLSSSAAFGWLWLHPAQPPASEQASAVAAAK